MKFAQFALYNLLLCNRLKVRKNAINASEAKTYWVVPRVFPSAFTLRDQSTPKVRITILEKGLTRGYGRVIAEAAYIKNQKPPLNGKEEMEGIELLLF